jgi:hypothetical protein
MNDLVKRLRAKCKMLHQCVEMRREAADRIEELEDQLSFMTKECARFEAKTEKYKTWHYNNCRYIEKLKAEVKRLAELDNE